MRRRGRKTIVLGVVAAVMATAPGAAHAQLPCVPPLCTPAPAPMPTTPTTPTTPAPPPTPVDPSPGTVPAATTSQVTTLVDPQHTSYAADFALAPPLNVAWTRDLTVDSTEAVAGDGLLFATVGRNVRAYDAASGKQRWTVPGPSGALAYDAGRVFAAQGQNLLALAAADGHELWRRRISSDYDIDTVPVAAAGRVYLGTPSGTSDMLSLDAATGTLLWTAGGRGTGNTPTVQDAKLFGSYACGLSVGWNRTDGIAAWATTSDCSGGGGSTPTFYDGRLYVPENGGVYDATSGMKVGTTPKQNGVFAAGLAIYVVDPSGQRPRLRATRLSTGKAAWSRALPNPEQGAAYSYGAAVRPVGVGSTLYMIFGGRLLGYDLTTGRPVESGGVTLKLGETGAPRIVPLGGGRLLLAGGKTLLTLQTALRPAADAIAARASTTDVLAGSRFTVDGALGTQVPPTGRAVVEADTAPFDGKYHKVGSVAVGRGGRFKKAVKLDRNARLRVSVGRRRAAAGTVYVYPSLDFHLTSAGSADFRVAYRVHTAKGLDLGSRGAVVYIGRPSKHVYVRLGKGPLRRVRAGVYQGSIVARRRRSVSEDDFVTLCIPRSAKLGLGRQDAFARGCGRQSIALTR